MRAQGNWVERGARRRNDVSDEPRVARRGLAHGDRRPPDGRMLREHGFDFAQFDAEPADLDLLIAAAEEVEAAVGPEPRQIARAIQAAPGRPLNGSGTNRSPVRSGCPK